MEAGNAIADVLIGGMLLKTQILPANKVPYTFKVYSDETKSLLFDEKSIDRDDLEVTFEVSMGEPQE